MRLIDANKLGLTDFEILMCDGDYKEALKSLLSKIDNAPTIDATPVRHGHWTHERLVSTSGGTYAVVRCSECKWQHPMLETKFCPNCGAKMYEEEP